MGSCGTHGRSVLGPCRVGRLCRHVRPDGLPQRVRVSSHRRGRQRHAFALQLPQQRREATVALHRAEPQPAAVHAVSALGMAADDFEVHAQLRVQHNLLQPTALGLELLQERAPSRAYVRNLAIPPRPRELFDCKPTAVCQHRVLVGTEDGQWHWLRTLPHVALCSMSSPAGPVTP